MISKLPTQHRNHLYQQYDRRAEPRRPRQTPSACGFDDQQRTSTSTSDIELQSCSCHCQQPRADDGQDQPQPVPDIYSPDRPRLPFRQRMKHFTWAWYTVTMSTGGLSVLIFNQPHQFPGLRAIGLGSYIANILLFLLITAGLATRFILFPKTLAQSITHPRESFFFPTLLLSVATLITSTERYVVPPNESKLIDAIQGSFWAYMGLSIIVAVAQYAFVFARHRFRPFRSMMPTWILPIFPVMLTGTIASVVADTQPDIASVPIIVAGLTCQGLGLSVAGMMYALMVGRLFCAGLPGREHRPGLFMCVGPPAFTALALLGMANGLPEGFDADGNGLADVDMLRALAVVAAVFLWALSFWWFGIAALAVVASRPKYFHLGWWATVFPNVGFTLATISLGRAMRCDAILEVATGMSVLVAVTYVFVFCSLVRAVLVQDIMYPGRDEDFRDSS